MTQTNVIDLPQALLAKPLEDHRDIEQAFRLLFHGRPSLKASLAADPHEHRADILLKLEDYRAPLLQDPAHNRAHEARMLAGLELNDQDIEVAVEDQIKSFREACRRFDEVPTLQSALRLKNAFAPNTLLSPQLDPLDICLDAPRRAHLEGLAVSRLALAALEMICDLADDPHIVWNALFVLFNLKQPVPPPTLTVFGRLGYFNTLCCQLAAFADFPSPAAREAVYFTLLKSSDQVLLTHAHHNPADVLSTSSAPDVRYWMSLNLNSVSTIAEFLQTVTKVPANDETINDETILAALWHLAHCLDSLGTVSTSEEGKRRYADLAIGCSHYFLEVADALSNAHRNVQTLLFACQKLQKFDLFNESRHRDQADLRTAVLQKIAAVFASPDKQDIVKAHAPDHPFHRPADKRMDALDASRLYLKPHVAHVFNQAKGLTPEIWFPAELERVEAEDLGNWLTLVSLAQNAERYDRVVKWLMGRIRVDARVYLDVDGVPAETLIKSLLQMYPKKLPIEGVRLAFLRRVAARADHRLFTTLGFSLMRIMRAGHVLPPSLFEILSAKDTVSLSKSRQQLLFHVLKRAREQTGKVGDAEI